MIEEIELPIHAIIRVTGSPQDVSRINPAQLSNLAATNSSLQDSESIKSLNFIVEDYPNYTQSKNPLIVGILEQIKNSSETSLWRQVAWGDVFASNSKDYKDVFDMLAHSSYTILEKRKVHQSFYAYMPQISIPVVEKGSLSKIDLKYYDHLFTEIGSERAVDSDLILSLLLEHICRVVMIMDASGNNGASNTASSLSQTEEIGVLEYHLEQQIDRLGSTLRETHLGTHTFHPDFGVAESSLNGDVSNHGDDHSIFSKHLEGLTAFDIQSKEILKNLRSAYPAAKFSRLLSSAFSQVSPEILMKIEQEQTLLRAELGRFVHMTQSQLRRTLLQFEFENLIGCTDGTTNLNEYCWVESLSPSAMTQVIKRSRGC